MNQNQNQSNQDDPTKSKDFIDSYWKWFDNLSITDKKIVWNHSQNYTDVYYYFKFYNK